MSLEICLHVLCITFERHCIFLELQTHVEPLDFKSSFLKQPSSTELALHNVQCNLKAFQVDSLSLVDTETL